MGCDFCQGQMSVSNVHLKGKATEHVDTTWPKAMVTQHVDYGKAEAVPRVTATEQLKRKGAPL